MLTLSQMRQAINATSQNGRIERSEVASQALRGNYCYCLYSKAVKLLTDASKSATVEYQPCIKRPFPGPTVRDCFDSQPCE